MFPGGFKRGFGSHQADTAKTSENMWLLWVGRVQEGINMTFSLGISMDFRSFLFNSMDFRGSSWIFMALHRFLWIFQALV
jgi:hypothetical protein